MVKRLMICFVTFEKAILELPRYWNEFGREMSGVKTTESEQGMESWN